MRKYYPLPDLVRMIDSPNGDKCVTILEENEDLFRNAPGSSNNHQNWSGGYWGHIQDSMNVATVLHPTYNELRPLPFSLSDALLVLFLHDLEKPWKYSFNKEGVLQKKEMSKDDNQQFREKKIEEYGIILTPDQKNGLDYV